MKRNTLNALFDPKRAGSALAVAILSLGLTACDVDKVEDGEAPDVDISAEAGKLPDYDIVKKEDGKMPDVDVDFDAGKAPKYEVETADIDVETKTVEVEVPSDVDVTMPDDDGAADKQD